MSPLLVAPSFLQAMILQLGLEHFVSLVPSLKSTVEVTVHSGGQNQGLASKILVRNLVDERPPCCTIATGQNLV